MLLRVRGGSHTAADHLLSSDAAVALPRSLELAAAAVERWWLVFLICAVNLEVAWRGSLLALLALAARAARAALALARVAGAAVLVAWAVEKAQLTVRRGQRPPARTALLTYAPFAAAR